jgi:hypothetical protein
MIIQLSLSRPEGKLRSTRDEFKAESLNGIFRYDDWPRANLIEPRPLLSRKK